MSNEKIVLALIFSTFFIGYFLSIDSVKSVF